MKLKDLSTVVCRPALPKDTLEVINFTQQIWEGGDYVPYVWKDWLTDYDSFLAVAEYAGKVVGTGRLTQLCSDEWWLEGLRVRPQYQGYRIASHIHGYILNFWERQASGTVRLGTTSTRYQVHHLCNRYGFSQIAEYSLYKAPCLDQGENSFSLLKLNDIQLAMDTISDNPLNQLTHGLMDHGWQWSLPSVYHLKKAISQNQAWWWRDLLGLLIYRNEWEGKQCYPLIQLLACPWNALEEFLLDYRRKGANISHEKVGWLAPLNPELETILTTAGFIRSWDDSLIIFEKKHKTVPVSNQMKNLPKED